MIQEQKPEILAVSGVGATQLLQGQLSCDVTKANALKPRFGAHCNPQGRVMSLFHLYADDATYYLFLPTGMAAIAQKALAKYALFYKVSVQIVHDIAPLISRWPVMTHHAQIRAGIPQVYPQTSALFLPHDLNLQQWDAIDFNKGCFTGQEIIARMQYRGKLKKQMYSVSLSSDSIPIPGTPLYGNDAGTAHLRAHVVDACQTREGEVLALIVVDHAHAHNEHLYLQHEPNHYCHFDTIK